MITANEEAFILKKDGSRKGPYKAKFAGDTVVINDKMADIDDGDFVVRVLPNGKEEHKEIYKANFYDTKLGGFGPHFQLKVGPKKDMPSFASQHINIHGGNVQIGNHNRLEISNSIETLNNLINNAETTTEQKEEAKGLLRKLAEHPLITALAGGAIGLL
ncbi:TPA: hypothetical protein R1R37_002562 [Klebsiella aerogenes]|uniref:hypothetical protein n=1 Tax=Klebsiella TaxID=570 RepID=UPI00277CEE90|nr:hypothetical protein [Klebsiella aerogenes]EIX9075593.1 hypothetical protein [Klebsiella aerogenes]MDU3875980.1 hypothetical protein [Klebsiella aerogenes]WPS51614.1 hypothetical protein SM911_07635 [Klebsiella aerogenes]HBT5969252.1 hypothetical protein [Klebsiella aerogenes]HDS2748442.1 hypothetical protein [Klebsiella aerogenes]